MGRAFGIFILPIRIRGERGNGLLTPARWATEDIILLTSNSFWDLYKVSVKFLHLTFMCFSNHVRFFTFHFKKSAFK